jgi:hypothetical protein
MPRPVVLALLLLIPVAVFLGPMWLRALVRALKRPQTVSCSGCGAQIHPSHGTRCAACVTRANQLVAAWAEIETEQRRRARALDAERREAERVASRAPIRQVGSVTVDPFGAVTFDSWVFGSRPGMTEGEVIPLQGRIPPTSLICGWRQSELHALAHGEHCTCLSRMGAWVR